MNDMFNRLYIFEIANNHQGNVEHGLQIIRAMGKIARKYNIKGAVKFQYRDLDTLIHPDYINRTDVKHIPRFMSTRLTPIQFLELVNAVHDEGLVTITTPFDETSVELAIDHGIDILKIASACANDWPLLEAIVQTKRPVICSTGGKTIDDIDNVVSFFTHRSVDFAILHCVGIYPTENKHQYLNFIDRLQMRYPFVPIGYSGHEAPDNLDVVKVAIAKKAQILERHIGIATDSIKLNAYSMNPEQVDKWIEASLIALELCGNDNNEKRITQEEIDSLVSLSRGVYVRHAVKKGEPLKRHDIFFAMPCQDGQTKSGEFSETMAASQDYDANSAVYERRPITSVSIIRGLIHDIKGMFYEARIMLGDDYEIELSHHYGMEHFRNTGALIVTLINREYCKKLVAMLPAQSHPNHMHKQKEETFQLLWGDMEIKVNGQTHLLNPGDKMLVERNSWHSFSSRNGCIFEEISTTHIKGDSYYEDDIIAAKDPIERKTVLEDW